MPYTAFISYNTAQEEQVVIYRLQTIASTSGITVLLPQRNGAGLNSETKLRIDAADSVIAFLTTKPKANIREELAYAQGKNKLIIPIYGKGVRLSGEQEKYNWIPFDPQEYIPGEIEKQVARLFKGKKQQRKNREAYYIVGLGLVLFALAASNK